MDWPSAVVFAWLLIGLDAVVNRAVGQEPTIILPQGKLTGVKMYTDARSVVNAYLGIPYASPPTGALRFAAPERHPGWNRTLFADKFGASCPQLASVSTTAKVPLIQDENCLFLNVWAPEGATSYRNAPVVVFLEGEGFVSGSSSRFPGQDLAAEGVVVVTANYRLNVFGFLCLEDGNARGNLGLLDQYFALLWVRENIESFGGDSRSVTLMGHSAGAASVIYHMVSPRTIGLFNRAIVMSGSVTSPWNKNSAQAQAGHPSQGIARSLGCTALTSRAVLLCLRGKTTSEILRAFETQYKNGNWSELVLPVVDSYLPESEQYLPRDPEQVLQEGTYRQIPVLTGTTTLEGMLTLYEWGDLIRQSFSDVKRFFNTTAILNAIEHYGLSKEKQSEIQEIIKWQYLDRVKEGDINKLISQLLEFYSDVQFKAPHEKQVSLLALATEPVYVYSFEQSGPDLYGSTINISGSAHGTELLYLFAPTVWQQIGRRMTPNEERLSKNIKRLWVDFIRQGNPLPGPFGYGLSWNRYTRDGNNVFAIKSNLQRSSESQTNVDSAASFWNDFLPRINNIKQIDKGPGKEIKELQHGSDVSQPFRSAMYTLIGFVAVLFVMLIICLVLLKKRAKERDRDLF